MRGTSQASLTAVEGRWEPVVEAAGSQATVLGEQLYALVDALDASGSLRRVLADPSVEGDAKAGLAAQLLAAADPRTIAVVQDLVRSRWSADADLADAAQRRAVRRRVQVGLDRPRRDRLAVGLAHLAQRHGLPVGRLEPQFLAELPAGRVPGGLVGLVLALRHRPRPGVTSREERPTHMAQQHSQTVFGVPVQQQARAASGGHTPTSGCVASRVSTVSAFSGRLSSR